MFLKRIKRFQGTLRDCTVLPGSSRMIKINGEIVVMSVHGYEHNTGSDQVN